MSSISRRKREWFELVSRPLAQIAASSPGPDQRHIIERLLEADRYLRYEVEPAIAVAIVKALFGSREPSFVPATRRYLRLLSTMALRSVRAKALPPKPSGREHHLTAHEERQLVRTYRELTRFFRQSDASAISLGSLNAKLERVYPAPDKRIANQHWPDVLRPRTPQRRAMTVIALLYPLGMKRIERFCYRADRAGHP